MKSYKTKKYAKFLVLALIILLAGAGFAIYKVANKPAISPASGNDTQGINYNPPTDEEKHSGDQIKDEITQKEQDQKNNQVEKKQTASVIITDASQYDNTIEVRAFISDHYQDGTCTITLTKDSYTVKKSTPAYRDASTTICTNPLFARSEFAVAGQWQVTVNYSSQGAQGTSSSQSINIR